ncbi:MAG: cytochrome c oxidase accessory protein CcoG [Myxococcota bacterium]
MLGARPVEGRFRRLRWAANAALIAVLVGIPWIRIGGDPLVLLDIPARQFHVFGLVIFPQELFFLWLIVIGLALLLFFITALLGRLWCGWACPQTVFTDVFAAIARRIEGWKGHRRPVRVAVWRKVAVHVVWFGLCAIVAFHLVGYFRSPYVMLAEWSHGEVSRTSMAFLGVFTLATYFDFAWVRQIFCEYLCPYARFQGVLFDQDTLVVGYDTKRGEPRGKAGKVDGDCVDCRLCVQVCPTGIDIRDGLQLSCIACTQCIDACDGVMKQVGRDPGLIAYRSLVSLEGERPVKLLRPRVAIYGALLVAVVAGFVTMLGARMPLDLHVAHNRAQLYSTAADGRVGNSFTLHIQNRDTSDRVYRIALQESDAYELVVGVNPVPVPAASSTEARVFVLGSQQTASPSESIHFVLEEVGNEERRVVRPTRFLRAPGAGAIGVSGG